jgi:hypothetical protein
MVLAFKYESGVAGLGMYALMVLSAAIVSLIWMEPDNGEYELWKRWHFGSNHAPYMDWLDQQFITGKPKNVIEKRKPARKDWRRLVGTDGEQTVYNEWYCSHWRGEYRVWMADYLEWQSTQDGAQSAEENER